MLKRTVIWSMFGDANRSFRHKQTINRIKWNQSHHQIQSTRIVLSYAESPITNVYHFK